MGAEPHPFQWLRLSIAAALALTSIGCRQQETAGESQRPTQRPPAGPVGAWKLFRGDAGLTGVAPGELPTQLVLRWSAKAGSGFTASPVLAGGRLYLASDSGTVRALALADGKRIWERKLGDGIEASPMLVDDLLVVGAADGTVRALDAASGQPRWEYQTDGEVNGSANLVAGTAGAQARLVVGSYDARLHCIDAATGKGVWTFETDGFINGTPAVADGRIVFGGCDANLRILDAATGSQKGMLDVGSYVPSSVAVAGEHAFLGHYGDRLICVDLSRCEIVWEYQGQPQPAPFFSSPAVTEDRVLAGARDGALHCVNRADGHPLWTFQTGGDVDSCPVVCGNKVVCASADGRVYLLRLSDGGELWRYEVGAPVLATPALGEGVVAVAAEDGRVYLFQLPAVPPQP